MSINEMCKYYGVNGIIHLPHEELVSEDCNTCSACFGGKYLF